MEGQSPCSRSTIDIVRGVCVVLISMLSLFCHVEAIEMSLDLDSKLLPGGRSTCGVLHCVMAGSEPGLSQISEMTIFKTSPGANSGGRSTVGSVSQRLPNVSTLWNGVKVDGVWSKQDTSMTLYLADKDDCRSAQFSCEVRYVDGLGDERVSLAQIGKNATPQLQGVNTFSASSSQMSAVIQQTNSALESTRHQLNNRFEDNLRHLENRMEDKIGALNNALLKLSSKTTTGDVGDTRDSQASLIVLEDQLKVVADVFRKLTDNVSILEDNVNDILRESISVVHLLNTFRQSRSEDFGLAGHNVSAELLNKVLEMVANGQLTRPDTLDGNGHAGLVQHSSCKRQDGKYRVVMSDRAPTYLCDSQTDGGGWIVIQRRSSGSVNFFRNWASYRDGFGSLADEFWLGNERIHALTSLGRYELMVSMRLGERSAYAQYDFFALGDEASNYTLELGTYTGTAGNSLGFHGDAQFSTFDRDHDNLGTNCARVYIGAWWYGKTHCHASNLNGKWGELNNKGPRWGGFSGDKPVTFSEMKIRRLE
ncbi:hypothetical protein RRG08_060274 [Elysia crispata]|uniref:Fibrinogen C-terminal domain-containing protein n=1 Tax=Elysia crispata TaxID=231223 RepID=A0AAE1B7M6_9GAST|nr:hypothetical protein RRG08_060274 [Elysia crispata]